MYPDAYKNDARNVGLLAWAGEPRLRRMNAIVTIDCPEPLLGKMALETPQHFTTPVRK